MITEEVTISRQVKFIEYIFVECGHGRNCGILDTGKMAEEKK